MILRVKMISIKVKIWVLYFYCLMSSVCELTLRHDQNISIIHSKLKSHAIIHNPPYNIRAILSEDCQVGGQPVKIVIDHSSRDINIITPGIQRIVLRTAINAFQKHRLQRPVDNSAVPASTVQKMTGKTCCICMEEIGHLDMTALPCAHTFHRQCIARWSLEQQNCPECRCPLT